MEIDIMSFQVKQKIKGTTYVYETKGKWDKVKKQCRHERVCIGKLDPVSGELIPSKKLDNPTLSRDYGNYYLLDAITKRSKQDILNHLLVVYQPIHFYSATFPKICRGAKKSSVYLS